MERKNKGITLVALVITIILMLILAGIVITLTLGEKGIITKARIAGKNYMNAQEQEEHMLETLENEVDKAIDSKEQITNANIGEYIDLGNNPLGLTGEDATEKNWRIFYVEDGKIYAILADYLPNSTGYANDAGLSITNTYSVCAPDRATLIAGLKHETAWNGLANEIPGAQAFGAPTLTLFKKSWNAKYKENQLTLVGDEENGFSAVSPDNIGTADTLFTPHSSEISGYYGYRLLSIDSNVNNLIWYMGCDGIISTAGNNNTYVAIRPVVSLPLGTQIEHTENVWKVQNK